MGLPSAPMAPPAYKEPPRPKPVSSAGTVDFQLPTHKPVAEVSPFSSTKVLYAILLRIRLRIFLKECFDFSRHSLDDVFWRKSLYFVGSSYK